MSQDKKLKKSKIKKVVIISSSVFLMLFVALLLVPVLFKDKILNLAKQEAEKMLLVDVDFTDFDLTLISTFPKITARLDNFKLVGQGEFDGVVLANIKRFDANLNFWDVINSENIQIEGIHIIEPTINVRILKNGMANYDIMKPDSLKTPEEVSEPSNFKLSLKEYSIQDADIKYDDRLYNMSADIKNLTHVGKGDLTAEIFDFDTETFMDELTYTMDGITYLSKVKTNLDAELLMEMTEEKYKFTLKENELALNELKLSFDGFYEMIGDVSNMDIKLKSGDTKFKDVLSLIPAFYLTGYESMVANGDLVLDGFVKGKMDDKNMPGWNFDLKVKNGVIKYPDFPQNIKNIVVDANTKFAGGENLDAITVDVNKFHADFANNVLDAKLKLRNPMSDPYIATNIFAKVDLTSLNKIMPMEETAGLKGKLNADLSLDGKMSSLDKEQYDKFNAKGFIDLAGFEYNSEDLNDKVLIQQAKMTFNPKNLVLEKLNAKVGQSDFQMEGKVDNYMDYVFSDELLKGDFKFSSSYLNLDELMNLVPTSTEEEEETVTASADPISIPSNIDFKLNSTLKKVTFNNIDIENISGNILLKEEKAILNDLIMNAMGGKVGLKGTFDAQNPHKPKMNFAYDLVELDVNKLATSFVTIEKLAPIAKYAQGKISSKLELNSAFTANLDPIFSTLTGGGDFISKALTISGFEPMVKIGNSLKMDKLNKQTINNISAKFQFDEGKIKVKPFNFKMGNITTEIIDGYTSFDQTMDFTLRMLLPKNEIPANIISAAEKGIDKINNVVPKIQLNSLPDNIPVNIKVLGEIINPKVTTDIQEQLITLSGNVKQQVVDAGKNAVNKAKDSVKTVVNTKVEDTKAKINEEKEKQKANILAEAQKQADKIKNEGKKAADLVRSEADKQTQKLIDEAGSNPIKKKAAELASNKIKKEAEEKASKIESEADSKAVNVLNTAQEKVNKI